jgi:hypothetical protein
VDEYLLTVCSECSKLDLKVLRACEEIGVVVGGCGGRKVRPDAGFAVVAAICDVTQLQDGVT